MGYVLFGGLEKKSMKIIFLSHLDQNLYLFRLPIMKELAQNSHEVYAACPKGEFSKEFEHYGIKHIPYKMDRGSLNPFKELIAIKNIYKALRQIDADIIHSFTVKPNIYGSIVGVFLKPKAVINTITGMGSFYIDNSLKSKVVKNIIEFLYKTISSKVDITLFQNSDDMRYFYENNLQKKQKCRLIKGSGIDTKKFTPSITHHPSTTTVLMVARAIWHKGIDEYYGAALILSKKYKDIKFILIGDTDSSNPSCADEEFLKNGVVEWLGAKKDVLSYIQKCDIFVLPSYREGISRTLLEASSCAKPMVTCDTIGCKEVVEDGKNGFLVPVGDSISLAKAIEKLYLDESLREEFGRYARQKAISEFDVEIIVKSYLEMYEEVI